MELESHDFDSRLNHIRRVLKEKFEGVIHMHHPGFTYHGKKHSGALENHLESFLSTIPDISLNDYEAFLLLCAIWLHDVGMAISDEDEDSNDIREKHHERSRDYIVNELKDIELNRLERTIVAELAFLHRKKVNIRDRMKENWTPIDQDDITGYGTIARYQNEEYIINIEKLGLLLRIIDGCDRDHERALNVDALSQAESPSISLMHNHVHNLVNHVEIKSDKSIILYTNVTDNVEENMITEVIVNDIRRELRSVEALLNKYNLNNLDVKQKSVTLDDQESQLSQEVHDAYLKWREKKFSNSAENLLFSSIEKSVQLNGKWSVVMFVFDVIVEKEMDEVMHCIEVEESVPTQLDKLQTMNGRPVSNRFEEQLFNCKLIDTNLEKELNISKLVERENIYNPYKYKEFNLVFNRPLQQNERIKYGFGYSAPDLHTQDDHTSHKIVTDTEELSLSLTLEDSRDIGQLQFIVLDENLEEIGTWNIESIGEVGDDIAGEVRHQKKTNIFETEHTLTVETPTTGRFYDLSWKYE